MLKTTLTAVLGACAFSMALNASVLAPGMTGAAPDALSLTGLTLVASESGVTMAGLTFNATLSAAVYSGANTVCASANCLTFAYQVTDNSGSGIGTGIIEDLTAFDFTGFTTDVGDNILAVSTGPFITGGLAPTTVGRAAPGPGAVVSFDYPASSSGNQLLPGTHTAVLLIETNATSFGSGTFSAIDGSTDTVAAFSPTASVPEPATMSLLGISFVSLALLLKRVRRNA